MAERLLPALEKAGLPDDLSVLGKPPLAADAHRSHDLARSRVEAGFPYAGVDFGPRFAVYGDGVVVKAGSDLSGYVLGGSVEGRSEGIDEKFVPGLVIDGHAEDACLESVDVSGLDRLELDHGCGGRAIGREHALIEVLKEGFPGGAVDTHAVLPAGLEACGDHGTVKRELRAPQIIEVFLPWFIVHGQGPFVILLHHGREPPVGAEAGKPGFLETVLPGLAVHKGCESPIIQSGQCGECLAVRRGMGLLHPHYPFGQVRGGENHSFTRLPIP